jgi:hypothetical protein
MGPIIRVLRENLNPSTAQKERKKSFSHGFVGRRPDGAVSFGSCNCFDGEKKVKYNNS